MASTSTSTNGKVDEPIAKPRAAEPADDDDERSIDNVLGQQILGDFHPGDLVQTAGSVVRGAITAPGAVARSSLGFLSELGLLAAGEESLEPAPGDRRFKDEAWSNSRVYSSLLQSYLAFCRSLERYAQRSSDDPRQAERIRFLMSQIADAVAPTNFLLGNPLAVRTARETRGMSLLRGARNLAGDVVARRPIPSQVDRSAFEVGRNLAVTPGNVVLRTEMFELIQYAPQTPQVHELPILIVPSIVNKFYIFDLAPERSVVEYFVRAGLTVFMIGWRNPQPRHDRWGMTEYQDAVEAAIDAVDRRRQQGEPVGGLRRGPGRRVAGGALRRAAPAADQLAAAVRRATGHRGDGAGAQHRSVHRQGQPRRPRADRAEDAPATDHRT